MRMSRERFGTHSFTHSLMSVARTVCQRFIFRQSSKERSRKLNVFYFMALALPMVVPLSFPPSSVNSLEISFNLFRRYLRRQSFYGNTCAVVYLHVKPSIRRRCLGVWCRQNTNRFIHSLHLFGAGAGSGRVYSTVEQWASVGSRKINSTQLVLA